MSRTGVFTYIAEITYPFIVGIAFQKSYQMVSKTNEQLQTELDTTKHVSMAKDHQISVLEEKLQAKEVKMTYLNVSFISSKENWRCCNRRVIMEWVCDCVGTVITILH